MAQVRIAVSDKHYQYLRQRAEHQGVPLDQLVSEIIEADMSWRLKLENDPMSRLIGQVDDLFDTQDADKVVYGLHAE